MSNNWQVHNGVCRDGELGRVYKNFCPQCEEHVVNSRGKNVRVTKGVYLPKEHECAVRVYDLRGNLLETKKL